MKFAEKPDKCNQFIDMEGYKFNDFTVIWYAGKINGKSNWYCKCVCWNISNIRSTLIRKKKNQCCRKCSDKKWNAIKHNMTWTDIHHIYCGIRQRCINENDDAYHNYWGRWIEFKFESFIDFIASVWERPSKKHSIERIDTNWHYEHGNCVWATQKEQANNTRKNIFLEHDSVIKTLSQWADYFSINYSQFYRKYRAWHLDGIFTKVDKYS